MARFKLSDLQAQESSICNYGRLAAWSGRRSRTSMRLLKTIAIRRSLPPQEDLGLIRMT